MSSTTREQLIAVATRQFAERGFYGASIASIARELGLTKQGLLHYFSTKEKLYGEVLQQISAHWIESITEVQKTFEDPVDQLEELILQHYTRLTEQENEARLMMRELLDNEKRAENAGNWFLQPYLDGLIDTVLSIEAASDLGRPRALALVYQLLGAGNYIAVSGPTLKRMFGEREYTAMQANFSDELRSLIRSRLEM